MDESTASGGGRGKKKCFWSKEEDNALVNALSDLNADPHWKCDNGFRNGYMVQVHGFKWDDERKMISVERSVYDEYCKVHSNCKNLYGHAFPHFDALLEIYGKEYAIGKAAEGFVDAINNMEKSATVQVLIDSGDDEDIIFSDAVESAPPLKKVKREHSIKRKGGKKEGESSSSYELASLQGFMKDMNVHLSTMANVMSRADERE
ncbi:hypothetical protein KSS87_013831 [Heliosperma pusillum]|nr:hypothetical protein KSS87_013831 [Heliosperma pusillum]